MYVYVLQTKDGQYYNGRLGDHYEMLTTSKLTEAYLCDSLSQAKVLMWRDKSFNIVPYEFNIAQSTMDLVQELRSMAVQAGKDPTQNDCLLAISGIDPAGVREKFPDIIDSF